MVIQFQNNHFDDERWIEAGPEAFAVYVNACEYSDRRDLDGVVPRSMLARVTLSVTGDNIDDAIETLLRLGFFAPAGRGNSVKIVGFLEQKIGLLAADKEETRIRWAENQRRSRKHRSGFHEMCNPATCQAARRLVTDSVTGDNTGDTTGDSSKDSSVTPQRVSSQSSSTLRNAPLRNAPLRSNGVVKERGVRSSDSQAPLEPSGSAGAPPAGPDPEGEALVFEGTSVQLATLLAQDLDPTLPQLRVETADGDADAMFVALPGDDLEQPALSPDAETVRAANRRTAEAMGSWGTVNWNAEGHYWLVCQADYETQQEYAKTFELELDRGVDLGAGT